MRKRVVRVAVVAVMVALVLLATPLAVGIQRSYIADERGELERAALAAAVRVGATFASGDHAELPTGESDARVGLYDLSGRLRDGHGPAIADPVTRRAMAGVVARGRDGQELVAAVPVSTAERVTGVVRAADGTQEVWTRVILTWLALAGTALAALITGVLVARRQARILSAPLEALSATAVAIADGDLTARADRSAIAEIDQVARTQNTMVERLTTLLDHERHFSSNASHQLRTPLAGLQLGLEAAATDPGADRARLKAAIEEALERSRHLQQTIDEVLRLARAAPGPRVSERSGPLGELVERVERRWHGAFAAEGRRLDLALEPGSEAIRVPDRTAEQILDVLLDNALRHGRGTVGVTVREMTGAAAVDVADEGALALEPGLVFKRGATTSRSGSGIGLPLARDMARAVGGRLTLVRASPTTFTLLLPMPEGE